MLYLSDSVLSESDFEAILVYDLGGPSGGFL